MTRFAVPVLAIIVSAIACRASAAPEMPSVPPPGPAFTPPRVDESAEGPSVFQHTCEAGPDETFFAVGEGLTGDLLAWGAGPAPGGQRIEPVVQFNSGRYLAATLPQQCYDGVFLIRLRSAKGFSKPIVLNRPQAWWLMPERAVPGGELAIYGRNLARRPDFDRSTVHLRREGTAEAWLLDADRCGKYRLRVALPEQLAPGTYRVWVHTGQGGPYGWSDPLELTVESPPAAPREIVVEQPTAEALFDALAAAAKAGGAVIRLPAAPIQLDRTLEVPAGVILRGQGRGKSVLRFSGQPDGFAFALPTGWGYALKGVGQRGDRVRYVVDVPQDGTWSVWLRYACDMSWWQKPGMSGATAIRVDGRPPVVLENLPNTGGYDWFVWRRAAELKLTKGTHQLTWENVAGGELNVDAVLLAADATFEPGDDPYPVSTQKVVVWQAEDSAGIEAARPHVPGRMAVAVWLAGDRAGLVDLSVQGCPAIDTGVLVRHEQFPRWLEGARLERLAVTGVEGHQNESRTVHLSYARSAQVEDCELWGRSPVYLAGARQCTVFGNRLVPQTRVGGGAEAAIVGRTNVLEQCVVEDNVVANPPGRAAGTPTTRRLIWVSTGHGSVSHNYFARNRGEQARFGGLPGTDQNVGEVILLEACQRIAFHGPAESADRPSVTLPATVPATPDEQLGTVVRSALATDRSGRETPFWPPQNDEDDGIFEPTIGQYYVTVLAGRGMGQTRRAVVRRGRTILLDRAWAVPPGPGDRVLVGTLFYQNLIVGNEASEGMSGVQLWYSCVENVVSDNVVRCPRGGGLVLVGACTTLASSMPTMWNRGLAPCYFNTFEGNLTENTTGSSFTGGGRDADFPLALGNVVRHNSMLDNRGSGISLGGSSGKDATPQTIGTIVELNLVRNVHESACHVRRGADFVVLRRNVAHFWQPFAPESDPAVFRFDAPGTYALENNVSETRYPQPGGRPVMERRTYKQE
jgi:hypothetical protein